VIAPETPDRQAPPRPLWIASRPLVLASKSAARRALLDHARIPYRSAPADVDERAIEASYFARGGEVAGLARALAGAKALAASETEPEAFCLGADQTLTIAGQILHKPGDMDEAAATLRVLAGQTHRLTSAFAIAREGRLLAADDEVADLTMRALDAGEIARYLERVGPEILSSVGAYQLERFGVHLFEAIRGEHSTILGMPMLKLLAWLRGQGLIAL
jgi:septum formation protein